MSWLLLLTTTSIFSVVHAEEQDPQKEGHSSSFVSAADAQAGGFPELLVGWDFSSDWKWIDPSFVFMPSAPGLKETRTITLWNNGNLPFADLSLALEPGLRSDYLLDSTGMATALNPGEQTSFTITFKPRTTGWHHLTVYIDSEGEGNTLLSCDFDGLAHDGKTYWRSRSFPASTPEADKADELDLDMDGQINFLEFAMGTPPHQPLLKGFHPTLTTTADGSLVFQYQRSHLGVAYGCQYVVEWNDQIGSTGWRTDFVTETLLNDGTLIQRMQAIIPAGTGAKFVRLRVE